MEEKAEAMRAWSEALTQAFLKAGGTMPKPSEGPRTRYYKAKKPRCITPMSALLHASQAPIEQFATETSPG